MPRRTPPAKGPHWSAAKALPLFKEQLRKLEEFKGKPFPEVERDEDEWEQFTRSLILHAFGEDSPNARNHSRARSAGIHNIMGISAHQQQLNFQVRIAQYEATVRSSIRELEASLPEPDPTDLRITTARPRINFAARPEGENEPLILISHSSKDVELAAALVEYLQAGLLMNRIRCSSVDGYRLPAGVNTGAQLRAEVNSTRVLVGLITPNSLASAYVMFELGARWGSGSFMIPLLAGVRADEIRGPLSGLNSLCADNESQLHQLLSDVADVLGMSVQNPASYLKQLSSLRAKANEIKLPTPPAAAAASVEETKQAFTLSLAIVGAPPSPQALRVEASRVVKVVP